MVISSCRHTLKVKPVRVWFISEEVHSGKAPILLLESHPLSPYCEVPYKLVEEGMVMEWYTFGLDKLLMFVFAVSSALVIILAVMFGKDEKGPRKYIEMN